MNARSLNAIGRWLFLLGWLPFIGVFIGIMSSPNDSFTWAELPQISRVSLILAIGMLLTSVFLSLLSGGLTTLQNKSLQTQGRLGDALILNIGDTGTTVNDDPVVDFHLRVMPMDSADFEAYTQKRVSRVKLSGVQPGSTIKVRYNLATKKVAIADEANIG